MLIFIGLCLIFFSIMFQTWANADWHREARAQNEFYWKKQLEILLNDRYVEITSDKTKEKTHEKTPTL